MVRKLIFYILLLLCTNAFAIDLSSINYDEYSQVPFDAPQENTYYDEYTVFYKSYIYEETECITEYIFSGTRNSEREVILYNCFEMIDGQLHAKSFSGNGNIISDVKIAGFLEYDTQNSGQKLPWTVYGYEIGNLTKPLKRFLLYKLTDSSDSTFKRESQWPIVYDYETNVFSQFIP